MTDYTKFIRPGTGVSAQKSDLTPLYMDPTVFSSAVEEMVDPFRSIHVDKVVALDASGFIFGSRVAEDLNTGFVLIRNAGKISVEKESVDFKNYIQQDKTLEIAIDSVKRGEKVIIVDDWAETGVHIKAAITLVERLGGEVVGVVCFNINPSVTADPVLKKYKLHSLTNM
jgi:adenine phosphoribosyltransferase